MTTLGRHVTFLGIFICLDLFMSISLLAPAQAQGLSPPGNGGGVVGGAGGLRPPTPVPLLNGEDLGMRRHLGPTGKPCLTIRGQPRAETINPKLFIHMIVAANDCYKRIKLQVCYYRSQHCVAMDVPPYGHEEVVLGVMPAMSGFRFEFREQFDPF